MIKCIAIDDEPLALQQLGTYISRIPFLQLVKACGDAFEAMQILAQEEIELLFLDIHMPDLNGLDFIRSLSVRPLIVFTTAYSEYAVEGFKEDAVDYLLKPFTFQDFLKAANKARKQYEYRRLEIPFNGETSFSDTEDCLFVKSEYKIIRVDISNIKYIEGMNEYVRIYTDLSEKPILTLLSMHKLEEHLPSRSFMRVHRSYIVNLQQIREIARSRIIFDSKTYIPVGDNYKEKFMEYINNLSLGK